MKVTFTDTSATQYDTNADLIDLSKYLPQKQSGKLYLGDRFAGTYLQIKHRQCTHIINCDKEIHSTSREENITYLNIDPTNENLSDYDKAYDFIERALNSGKTILVLCQTGNGKSAGIIVYYIMKKLSKNPFESIDILKKIRSKIRIPTIVSNFITREAKRLGLLTIPTKGNKHNYTGYYILFGVSVFFVVLYFILDMLTVKKVRKKR